MKQTRNYVLNWLRLIKRESVQNKKRPNSAEEGLKPLCTSESLYQYIFDKANISKTISKSSNPINKQALPLKLMSLNIQSILAKKASFDNLMDDYNPDIVAISETWLSSDIPFHEFFPKGYHTYRKDRVDGYGGKGGGIGGAGGL